jgi:VWFA-related protein
MPAALLRHETARRRGPGAFRVSHKRTRVKGSAARTGTQATADLKRGALLLRHSPQSTFPSDLIPQGGSVERESKLRRLLALFSLAAVSLFSATPGDDAAPTDPKPGDPAVTFRSDVSLKRVDAQVVDTANRPITGLTKDDFVLRENGKQQEIRDFQTERMPVDVLLLLDVSGSMQPHVRRIASAAHQALRVLGGQDRVAIMVFDRSTRIRLPFRDNRRDVERELRAVLDQETFDGGTDITRALLEAADYMSRNARREARRAIVILTDDQTQFERNDRRVLLALDRADSILSALIAPDALHTGSRGGSWPDDLLDGPWGHIVIPRGLGVFGARTRSAGTSEIAKQSGGDSMAVENASAFEDTLARIRERYALFFYLPEGEQQGDEGAIAVELSDAARQRFPGAGVRHRRSIPGRSTDSDDMRPTRV